MMNNGESLQEQAITYSYNQLLLLETKLFLFAGTLVCFRPDYP